MKKLTLMNPLFDNLLNTVNPDFYERFTPREDEEIDEEQEEYFRKIDDYYDRYKDEISRD